MSAKKTRGLTGRMLFSMLLVHLVLIPLLFVGVLRFITDDYKNQFVNFVRSQAHLFAEFAEVSLHHEPIAKVLDTINVSGQTVYVDFKPLGAAETRGAAETASGPHRFQEDFYFGGHGDKIYFVAIPLYAEERMLGTLRFGFDEAPIAAKITTAYTRGFYLALGYTIISLSLMFAFGVRLTQSLRRLSVSSRAIATDLIHTKVDVKSNISEVAALADALESMRQELVKRGDELLLREMRQRAILETAAEGVITLDEHFIIESFNNAAERMFGYSTVEVIGAHLTTLLPEQDLGRLSMGSQAILSGGQEFCGRTKAGEAFNLLLSVSKFQIDTTVLITLIAQDISERKRIEKQLEFMASHDVLTGLPNRSLFHDRLVQAMTQADRHHHLAALLFIDLDRFKIINDTFGHQLGDLLLCAVAQRLRATVRAFDTVARLGGDEFTIVLTEIRQANEVADIAQKVLATFEKPFMLECYETFVTPSIGIALYPLDHRDAEGLTKNADIAMYRAKEHGKNNFQFYTQDMNVRALERLTLETSLRKAIDRGEFLLHYQPQVSLATGCIIGVEALLRWRHPELGLVPPTEFIPLAEEVSLIAPIGEWVFREACEQALRWQAMGFEIRTAINVSPRQVRQGDLVKVIQRILTQSGIAPRCIEFEITEGSIMHNAETAIEIFTELKKMGFSLAMDDFGTGYSSLSYLQRFPIDKLKIDQSFVHNIHLDAEAAAITRAIIAMAHSINVTVVAEGVETEEQLAFLRAHQCEAIQGYLFSKPLPADELTGLLLSNTCLPPAFIAYNDPVHFQTG